MSSAQMSVSQEINDTLELIDQLHARFHQPKVYLVGFSYGTYLGVLVAQRCLSVFTPIFASVSWRVQRRRIEPSRINGFANRQHGFMTRRHSTGSMAKSYSTAKNGCSGTAAKSHSAHTW
jgi:alpha/beta superfamily hydrolase